MKLYIYICNLSTLNKLIKKKQKKKQLSTQTETLERRQREDIKAIRKGNTQDGKIYKSRGLSNKGSNKKCFRCDGIYPHQSKCPAEGQTCKCEKKGHYARCCKSKTEVQGKNVPFRGRTPNFHENKHRKPLNQIAHSPHSLKVYDSYEQSDSDESLFAIRTLYDCPVSQKEQVYLQSAKTDFQTTVRIENQKVRVLIDSGASVNVLNERTFTALNKRLNNALNLEKTKTNFGKNCCFVRNEKQIFNEYILRSSNRTPKPACR